MSPFSNNWNAMEDVEDNNLLSPRYPREEIPISGKEVLQNYQSAVIDKMLEQDLSLLAYLL